MRANGTNRAGFPFLEVVGLVFIVIATIILVAQLASFSSERQRMPTGLIMAGVPVGGMPRADAQAYVEQTYGAPITVYYRENVILLNPDQVGLRVDSQSMLSKADSVRSEGTFWSGFW